MSDFIYKGHHVTAQIILRAMRRFDTGQTNFKTWHWKRWGVEHGGKVYPPKHLLRLATGVRTVEGGGENINTLFERLGFVVKEVGEATSQRRTATPDALDDLTRCEPQFDRETERDAIAKSRIGQGRFREELERMWGGCAVTGCTLLVALRASHIKPWRASDNRERLDPHNGLLLVANLDALFDAGVISFDDAGSMLIDPEVEESDRELLGVHPSMRLRRVYPQSQPYLADHRLRHGFE